METEQTEKKGSGQLVININAEQKAEIKELKSKYNLTDKGVIALLLEVANNNQVGLMPDDDGNPQEVDALQVIVNGLGLAKKGKVAKVKLTDEEKIARREARKQERANVKMQVLLAKLKADASGETPVETDEVETVVEIGA